ncbi:MAG: ABC transporter substrate-binding protein [Candidatus Binatia bacterium]
MSDIKRMLVVALSFFSIIFVWLFPASVFSQTQKELIKGAKKEGKVVWYGSLSLEDLKRLANAFEKKYPFLKVDPFRASGERIANKILTETRGRRYLYDVVATGAFEIWPLYKRGLLGKYVSPESKAYGPAYKDPNGAWVDLYNNYYVVGYNTNLVTQKDAPKDWEDLLDPRWKGKFAVDMEEYEWYAAMLSFMGEEKGRSYMRRLAKQDIQWRKGHTLNAQLMIAGEFPTALIYAHRGEKMRAQGAPLDWAPSFEPIVSGMRVVSISSRPPHPNAAKLLFDYVISKEGQTLIRSFYRIPAHPDVTALSPRLDPKKLRLFPASPNLAEHSGRHIKEFREIFRLR